MNPIEKKFVQEFFESLAEMNNEALAQCRAIAEAHTQYIRAPQQYARDSVNEYFGKDAGLLEPFTRSAEGDDDKRKGSAGKPDGNDRKNHK